MIWKLVLVLPLLVVEVSSRCDCMNKIVLLIDQEDFRIVSSPDYPRYYCPNLSCMWRIVAPDNTSKVHFYADNLDLRDGKDVIEFYDHRFLMDGDKITPSHRCTGVEICEFKSSSQYLTISFKTADSEPDKFGFQGIVSARNRHAKGFLNGFARFCILIVLLILSAVIIVIFIFCCRRQHTDSKRVTFLPEDENMHKLLY